MIHVQLDASKIIGKLELQLRTGITTEAQALYLMVAVRKLLEHRQEKKKYEYLTFHCDWALHSKLEGTTAQKILKLFDAANIHLKTGDELRDLPILLKMEINRILRMKDFEEQLDKFLNANGLPSLETTRSDGLIHFFHLYAKIVEDCPLVMTAKNESATVASVMLNVDLAKEPTDGDMWFRMRWTILGKNGLSGVINTYSSFSSNPL